MSSANNHRKRSHRSYDKRVRTMNTLQHKTAIKKQTTGFFDMLRQKRQARKREKTPVINQTD